MRFTIKAKLGLAFGGLLACLAGTGYLGVRSLSDANTTMQDFNRRPFTQVQRVGQLQYDMVNTARVLNRALADPTDVGKAAARKDFGTFQSDFDSVMKQYAELVPAASRDATINPVQDAWSSYLAEAGKAWDMTQVNAQNKATDLAFTRSTGVVNPVLKAFEALQQAPLTAQQHEKLTAFRLNFETLRLIRFKVIVATDDQMVRDLNADYAAVLDHARADLGAIAQEGGDAGKAPVDALRSALQAYVDFDKEVLRLGSINSDAKAAEMVTNGGVKTTLDAMLAQLVKLKGYEGDVANGFVAEAGRSYDSTRTLLVGIIVAAVVGGLAMAAWIGLSISRSLGRAVRLAEAVAAGDLTQTVDLRGNDEITDLQRAMRSMMEKLREVVLNVTRTSDHVSSGSQELSASAEQLSQGSTEQASSTEEASASMEEMAANVKQNAENASQTETIARNSAKDAEASGAAVGKAVAAMQTIAGKITIVQEIARQTDLLALNAAVEAARAGEHGRGFAVVASEVRKLAERSQAAAAEISTLSADTVKTAQDAGDMLTRLVPDIRRTAELVEEITAACREQDVGAVQINQAIQQLDKVTQQNASAAEQVSGTSEELAAQAEQLQAAVSFFRLDAAHQAVASSPVAALQARIAESAPAVRATKARAPRKVSTPTGGFALDMSDAEDGRDAAFRRSA